MEQMAQVRDDAYSTDDELMCEREAGSLLGFRASTLRKWRQTGKGPRFLKIHKTVRYRRGDLVSWAARHAVNSTSEY